MITQITIIIVSAVVGYFVAKWQFKFQSVHERRLVVIEETYEKIKIVSRSFLSLTNPLQETSDLNAYIQEKEKDFVVKANNMSEYLDNKRLFFSTKERIHIDVVTNKFSKIWIDYRFKKAIEDDPAMAKKRLELYKSIWDSTSKEIPELIKSLEKVFEKELGLK